MNKHFIQIYKTPPLRFFTFLAMVTALCCRPAIATVIYSDSLHGGSATELDGTTPKITTGGAAWNASINWMADGSVTTDSNNVTAYLPFAPKSGNIYELSLANLQATGTSPGWVGLAFSFDTNYDGFIGTPEAPAIIRRSAGDTIFPGGVVSGASGGSIKIVLDTRGTDWKVDYYLDGSTTPVNSYTYSGGNPTNIQYVGIGGTTDGLGTLIGNAADFQLQTIP